MQIEVDNEAPAGKFNVADGLLGEVQLARHIVDERILHLLCVALQDGVPAGARQVDAVMRGGDRQWYRIVGHTRCHVDINAPSLWILVQAQLSVHRLAGDLGRVGDPKGGDEAAKLEAEVANGLRGHMQTLRDVRYEGLTHFCLVTVHDRLPLRPLKTDTVATNHGVLLHGSLYNRGRPAYVFHCLCWRGARLCRAFHLRRVPRRGRSGHLHQRTHRVHARKPSLLQSLIDGAAREVLGVLHSEEDAWTNQEVNVVDVRWWNNKLFRNVLHEGLAHLLAVVVERTRPRLTSEAQLVAAAVLHRRELSCHATLVQRPRALESAVSNAALQRRKRFAAAVLQLKLPIQAAQREGDSADGVRKGREARIEVVAEASAQRFLIVGQHQRPLLPIEVDVQQGDVVLRCCIANGQRCRCRGRVIVPTSKEPPRSRKGELDENGVDPALLQRGRVRQPQVGHEAALLDGGNGHVASWKLQSVAHVLDDRLADGGAAAFGDGSRPGIAGEAQSMPCHDQLVRVAADAAVGWPVSCSCSIDGVLRGRHRRRPCLRDAGQTFVDVPGSPILAVA
ncbi:hypothetical protein N2W54_003595 [Lotmaria passim]